MTIVYLGTCSEAPGICVPKFNLGTSENIRNQIYKIELKYLWGLTEYNLFDPQLGSLPESIKNNGFQLEFGYKLEFMWELDH